MPIYFDRNAKCSACHREVVGDRIICLVCISKGLENQIDLCLNCADQTPANDNFTHQVAHPVVKVRQFVHDREKAQLVQRARDMVERTKTLFRREGVGHPINGIVRTENDDARAPQPCDCCGNVLSLPCWRCVSCGMFGFHLACRPIR